MNVNKLTFLIPHISTEMGKNKILSKSTRLKIIVYLRSLTFFCKFDLSKYI